MSVNPYPRSSKDRRIKIEATTGISALLRYRGNSINAPTLPATEPAQQEQK